MSLDICECLWVSINVCAVFRRGVHIAQTLGARRGHWPDRVAQSGGLLTFYDPTPLSARFSSKTSNIQNQMKCCPKYVGFAFQICQMNSRGASSPLGMQSELLWLRWKMFERRGRTVPGWAKSSSFLRPLFLSTIDKLLRPIPSVAVGLWIQHIWGNILI